MAIIVEDGSIVANANSYASVATVRAFADARNYTLPVADADVEFLILKAMDVVESYDNQYRGCRYSPTTQALSWPRDDETKTTGLVTLDNGVTIAVDEIPTNLINALCQLAYDANTNDLNPNTSNQFVTEDKVGPLVTKYAEPGYGVSSNPDTTNFNAFETFLEPILLSNASGSGYRVTRV